MVIIKDKLKIKVLENNNELLPILINDIGKNLNAGEDIALVRFDTHPDLLVPKTLPADEIQTLDHLVESITNQCWILPAVYQGYVKTIFWFKPPWAHQFQDGHYHIQVGKCQQTGVLKVASTLPYFTSNCVYSSNEKLSNVQSVDVYVSTSGLAKTYSTIIEKSHASIYDNDSENINHKDSTNNKRIYALDATLVNQLLESKQVLLDIDLSFFSTDDPVRKQLDENEYEILRYLYTRIVQEQTDAEILQYITNREHILEQIRLAMNEYLTNPKLEQTVQTENIYLSALITIIRHKKLDWKPIHDYGMHLADTRPPLHVSSEGMILYLIEAVMKILESIKKVPILITLSRCVNDGFCSVEQADFIQSALEKKLTTLYQNDEVQGKSLSKSLVSYEDDMNDDDDTSDKKPSNDEINEDKSDDPTGGEAKTTNSESKTTGNLSPGEVKPASPSSLSEASPVSN